MIRRFVRSTGFTFGILMGIASAAAAQDPPAECRYDAQGRVDYAACAKAAPEGSLVWRLSVINLGTVAFGRRDFQEAVRLYDLAAPKGFGLQSDARFHAFRAAAYRHVGRDDEALEQGRLAVEVLDQQISGQSPYPLQPNDEEMVYAFVLPILHKAGAKEFQATLSAYMALPRTEWMSVANEAAVLFELKQWPAALRASDRAIAMAPEDAALLNNHCDILRENGRPGEALPFCERAIAKEPGAAVVHLTHAQTLASLGRCAESQAAQARARALDPVSADAAKPLVCRPA
jgi:tetratricopeptide (TPR) repeat protein